MGSGGSLLSFIGRRLLITIPLLLLISFGVFCLVLIIPGNPALTLAGGTHSNPAEVARITKQLHLNEPFWRQYLRWLNEVLHGNLGTSLFQHQSVASGIAEKFPVTLSLAVGGMLVAVIIGIPAGIISGVRQGTPSDRLVTFGSSLGVAIPDFWLALLLVIVFAVNFRWLPALGYVPYTTSVWGWFQHLILPWLALGIGGAATIARQVRGAAHRHPRPGLHAHGAGQGSREPGGHRQARAQERPQPGRDRDRHLLRLPARAGPSSSSRSSRCPASGSTCCRRSA